MQRVAEFQHGEYLPQAWIAEEEAQGTTLGLMDEAVALGLLWV